MYAGSRRRYCVLTRAVGGIDIAVLDFQLVLPYLAVHRINRIPVVLQDEPIWDCRHEVDVHLLRPVRRDLNTLWPMH